MPIIFDKSIARCISHGWLRRISRFLSELDVQVIVIDRSASEWVDIAADRLTSIHRIWHVSDSVAMITKMNVAEEE